MELEKVITERKEYETITRYYFSNSYEMEISPMEYVFQHSYIPKTGQYITITREFKEIDSKENDSFIDKVRATTELNKSKPFSQKYPIVATKIENSTKLGYNFCVMPLQKGEKEALEAEGFTVEIYSVWGFRIS